ncbi:MAG TPA: hypothetical protein VGS57_21620 [Thermoanaerobaculia bacterium]|jgi:hypothetical protein|nr:hypothetical protein [Thermoanaerobaculia bacterium]
MGLFPIQCYLGFSVHFTNSFSEHLERRSSDLARHYHEANSVLMEAFRHLHDVVDSASAGSAERADASLQSGLAGLAVCSDHLTSIGEGLVRTRSELFEREEVDAADPLIARERFFAALDYAAIYRELAAHGCALPQRVYWDDVVSRLRDGGARAGLRLLDRHLRELQSDLRSFAGEVNSLRRLPLPDLARALHGHALGVAGLVMGFIRLLASFTYFSLLCERASLAFEAGLESGDRARIAG